MKRTIIILSIIFTLNVAGILYGHHGKSDERESVLLEETRALQLPEHLPELMLEPMVGYGTL